MDTKLVYLDQCLDNTEILLKALMNSDTDTITRCLARNEAIMKGYDRTELMAPKPQTKSLMREKIAQIQKLNEQCFLYTEKQCRDLRGEIENTQKNSDGIRKYGAKQSYTPKFIDNKS